MSRGGVSYGNRLGGACAGVGEQGRVWVAARGLFMWVVYGEGRGIGLGSRRLRMGMEALKNLE